jgi:hypothetical protein
VAALGVELIESRRYRPIASIPRYRGALARLVGMSASLFLRAAPLFARTGRRNQARLLKSIPTEEE